VIGALVDGGDGAALAGHPSPLRVGGEGDDLVADAEAATAGRFDVGLSDQAGGAAVIAGEPVDAGSDPTVSGIERHGLTHVTVAELLERRPFG